MKATVMEEVKYIGFGGTIKKWGAQRPPVWSDDFWFCDLHDGRCERNQEWILFLIAWVGSEVFYLWWNFFFFQQNLSKYTQKYNLLIR